MAKLPFHQKQPDETRVIAFEVLGKRLVELTDHAVTRMRQRDISDQDVLETLANPTITEGLETQDGRKRYRRNKTARRAIDVIFEERDDRIAVVTTTTVERRIVERRKRR